LNQLIVVVLFKLFLFGLPLLLKVIGGVEIDGVVSSVYIFYPFSELVVAMPAHELSEFAQQPLIETRVNYLSLFLGY